MTIIQGQTELNKESEEKIQANTIIRAVFTINGNSVVKKDSIGAYELYVHYDNTVFEATNAISFSTTAGKASKEYNDSTVMSTWAGDDGLLGTFNEETGEAPILTTANVLTAYFRVTSEISISNLYNSIYAVEQAVKGSTIGTGNEEVGTTFFKTIGDSKNGVAAEYLTVSGITRTLATDGVTLSGDSVTVLGNVADSTDTTITATAKSVADADMTSTVEWSISGVDGTAITNSGVSIDTAGQITVSKTAKAGTYTVTATNPAVSDNAATATFTVARTPSAAAEIEVTPASVTVDGVNAQTVTAKIKDQYGDDMAAAAGGLTASENLNNTEVADSATVTVTPGGDGAYTISIPANAKAGSLTLTAGSVTQTVPVSRETAAAATIELNPTTATVNIPAADANANTFTPFTATVKNQYGEVMTGAEVTYTIKSAVTGVTVASDGKITVTDQAEAGTPFTVVATSGGVTAEAAVTAVALTFANAEAGKGWTINNDNLVYGKKWSEIITLTTGDNALAASLNGTTVSGSFAVTEGDPNAGEQSTTIQFTSTDQAYKDVTVATVTVNVAPFGVTASVPDISAQSYTGSQITPSVTPTFGGAELTAGTDYTIAYGANVNVGEAAGSVTVSPVVGSNYTFTAVTKNFTISPKELTDTMVTLSADSFVYNGEERKPTVTVKDMIASAETTLVAGTDYTVSYAAESTNVAAEISLSVAGQGNYTGSVTKTYAITAKSIADATVTVTNEDDLKYAAESMTQPTIAVEDGTTELVKDQDYTLAITKGGNAVSDNTITEAGDYTVTVTGKGNYDSATTATATFTVAKIDQPITVTSQGSARYNETIDLVGLVSGTMGDGAQLAYALAAGTASAYSISGSSFTANGSEANVGETVVVNVTAPATANYNAVSAAITITITDKKTLDAQYISFNPGSKIYSGSAQACEAATLTEGASSLTGWPAEAGTFSYQYKAKGAEDSEYTDQAPTNVGEYDVLVTYENTVYRGTTSGVYKITAKDASTATVTLTSAGNTYTGAALAPSISSVTLSSYTIGAADYDVSYRKGDAAVTADGIIDAGTYTVTVTFKGNFTGAASATYTIAPAMINADMITLKNGNAVIEPGTGDESGTFPNAFTYNGAEQKPTVEVKLNETTGNLTEKTTQEGSGDYSVAIAGAKEGNTGSIIADTYTVTVTAVEGGNYTGSAGKNYAISPKPLTGATVSVSGGLAYTGSALKPTVSIAVSGVTGKMVEGMDYTVSYGEGVTVQDVGTYTATVTAIANGNYTGSATATFAVAAKSLADADITVTADDLTYTGSALAPSITVKFGESTLAETTDFTLSYKDSTGKAVAAPTNAGVYTVTVTGAGNYKGSKSTTLTVGAKSLSDDNALTLSAPSFTYNGTKQTPTVTVKDGDNVIAPENYAVSYTTKVENEDVAVAAPTNVGEYTVVVSLAGNYSGELTKTYTITQATIISEMITLSSESFPYNGAAQQPGVTVSFTDGNRTVTLSEGTDYTYTITAADPAELVEGKPVNAGTYTVTVTAVVSGNYQESASKTYTITAQELTQDNTDITVGALAYTGGPLQPAVTVKVNGREIDASGCLSYSSATVQNAGTYTVTMTGNGNYTGTATATFTVAKADSALAGPEAAQVKYGGTLAMSSLFSGGSGTLTYTVVDGYGAVESLNSDGVLKVVKDQTLVESTVTVLVRDPGDANHNAAERTVTVTILDKTVAPVTLELSGSSFTYNGDSQLPTVGATATGASLSSTYPSSTEGWAITYYQVLESGVETKITDTSTIKDAGIYRVEAAYENDEYKGSASKTFTIQPATLTAGMISGIDGQTYTGSAITPAPTVKLAEQSDPLAPDADYTVAYRNNVNAGTATVSVAAKSANYTGTASQTFTINKKALDAGMVTLSAESFTYNGRSQTPTVTVTDGGRTLTAGTDYTVSYQDSSNNTASAPTNAGTYTVVVTGQGNYSGSVNTKTFAINAASLENATVTLATPTNGYTYDGSAKEPAVTVKLNGVTVSATQTVGETTITNYTVGYSNNTAAGAATVTIIGQGNYTGSKTAEFTINKEANSLALTSGIAEVKYGGTMDLSTLLVKESGAVKAEGAVSYTITSGSYGSLTGPTLTVENNSGYAGQTIAVKVAAAGDANHEPGMVTIDVSILNKNTANVTFSPVAVGFGGTVSWSATTTASGTNPTWSYTWIKAGETGTPTTVSANASGAVTGTNLPTAAGSYTVSAIYEDDENKGSATETFTITPQTVAENAVDVQFVTSADANGVATSTAATYSATYTGSVITPQVVVAVSGTVLTRGIDYTVTYANNINAGNAGNATATISFIGNYSGNSVSKNFTITPRDLSNSAIVSVAGTYTYSGSDQKPVLSVKAAGTPTLLEDYDYTVEYDGSSALPTTAGVHTATVRFQGNYSGTASAQFEIGKKSIGTVSVEAPASAVYSVGGVAPSVIVKDGNTPLTPNADYNVTYKNYAGDTVSKMDAVGKYTIVIEGRGSYSGETTRDFEITPRSLAGAMVTAENKTYTGTPQTSNVTVTVDGKALTAITDYTVSGNTGTNAGTYTITVEAVKNSNGNYTGNYTGKTTKTFTIAPKSISGATVAVNGTYTYDGTAKTPTPTVTDGTALISGRDYSVSYSGNVNAGNARVIIIGMGNYTGSASQTFEINKAASPMTATSAVSMIASSAGNTKTLDLSTLVSGAQGTPQYRLPSDAKGFSLTGSVLTAPIVTENIGIVVTVTDPGAGNFGEASKTITVTALPRTDVSSQITLGDTTATYTGSPIQANAATLSDGLSMSNLTYTYSGGTAPTDAGTYTVTATYSDGDNYGTKMATLTINAKSITGVAVTQATPLTYNGTSQTGTFTVKDGSKTLTPGVDYTVIGATRTNAGTYSVTIEGQGNYSESETGNFTIAPKSISGVSIAAPSVVYDGTAQAPALTVTDGAATLVKGRDYTVTYSNNTNAGTGTATLTGMGNYTGTAIGTFTIEKAERTDEAFTVEESGTTLNGSVRKINLTVVANASDDPIVNNVGATFSSSNTEAISVNSKGEVTAIASGSAVITVSLGETENYKASTLTRTVAINAMAEGVTEIKAVKSANTGSSVTATLSNVVTGGARGSITLAGLVSSPNGIETVSVTYLDSTNTERQLIITLQEKDGSGGKIAYDVLSVSLANSDGSVSYIGGTLTISGYVYTVDTSKLEQLPATVVPEMSDNTVEGLVSGTEDEKTKANAAANSLAPNPDSLVAAMQKMLKDTLSKVQAQLSALGYLYQELAVQMSLGVAAKEYDESGRKVKLGITPQYEQYAYETDEEGNRTGKRTQIGKKENQTGEMDAPIEISTRLPAEFKESDRVVAKHYNANGQVDQYLPVNWDRLNGVATFFGTHFSDYELSADPDDTRVLKINYHLSGGEVQTYSYANTDITNNTALLTDTPGGWATSSTAVKKDITATTITEELFTKAGAPVGNIYTLDLYAIVVDGVAEFTVTDGGSPVSGATVTITGVSGTQSTDASGKATFNDLEYATSYSYTVSMNGYETKSGTFVIDKSVSKTMNVSVALTKKSSGAVPGTPGANPGSVSSSATVTIAESTNGSVTVSDANAKAGDTVTVTVTPNSGYKTASVKVRNAGGNAIRLTENSDGTYRFTMPAKEQQPVSISATFEKAPVRFIDVADGVWYADAVAWAVANDVTNGKNAENTFKPNDTCTRAEAVTFLYRAAGSPDVAVSAQFKDVAVDKWYTKAVAWAVANGITNGKGSEGAFKPDDTCTRAEIVTFLARFEKASDSATSTQFKDVAATDYCAGSVAWAAENGITKGKDAENTFKPGDSCTRAEIVTFLYRDFVR